jgi:hypothetical protein
VDFIADYQAEEMDVHLTTDRQGALLTFLTPRGWVGVRLDRTDLEGFKGRISKELSRRVPPTANDTEETTPPTS